MTYYIKEMNEKTNSTTKKYKPSSMLFTSNFPKKITVQTDIIKPFNRS